MRIDLKTLMLAFAMIASFFLNLDLLRRQSVMYDRTREAFLWFRWADRDIIDQHIHARYEHLYRPITTQEFINASNGRYRPLPRTRSLEMVTRGERDDVRGFVFKRRDQLQSVLD